MAIQDTDNQTSNNTFSMGGASQASKPAAQPQQQSAQPISFRNAGALTSSPLGRNAGGELVALVSEKLNDVYKAVADQTDVRLLALDNNNITGLAFSTVIVTARWKNKRDAGVAYHALILEGTNNPILPKIESINNRQIEILRPTSAAWDDVLVRMVSDAVAEAYPNTRILNAGATVIPRQFNLDNKNDVYNMARNTITAISNEIDVHTPGFRDLNLEQLEKGTFVISMRFERTQIADDVGQPMRSDIQFEYLDQHAGGKQNNQSVNSGERSTVIGKMSSFIDFNWAPVAMPNHYGGGYPQAMGQLPGGLLPTQKYVARQVITQIEPTALATLPAILNLLAVSAAASENNNWHQTFMARGNKTMHDVGGLNVEANVLNDPSGKGQRIDTSGDNFRETDLRQMLMTMVRPGLAIAIDVPDCGPQTWYSDVFAAAASGSQQAQSMILSAADYLTNNTFSRNFPAGTPIFTDQGNRVHLGYYPDKATNQLQDIRNIDYLAVINTRGVTDESIIARWSDTFTATNLPLAERLDVRARIIREIAPNATITGFATRCTFTEAFLAALYQSIAACGVRPVIQTNGTAGIHADRGVASFASSALLQAGQGAFFGGYGGQQATGPYVNTYQSFNRLG